MTGSPASVERSSATPTVKSAFLRVDSVGKSFGTQRVLESISLDIERGEFLTLLGESGSGKTTLLRIIAGFEQVSAGQIFLEAERLDMLPPHRRPVHTVFQSYALFPHLNVCKNIAFPLKIRRAGAREIDERVKAALA